MTWIDYAIVALCIASSAFGYWRGFVKEAIALVTWLLAILLGEWTAAPELRVWAARAIIFVAVLVIGGLLAWLLRAVIRKSGLSSTDRSLGAVFGVLRGALLVGLLAIVVDLADLQSESWWADAKLRPLSEQIAEGIVYYAGLGRRYIDGADSVVAQLG
jgi:membrane protein required for colicin V production